MATLGKSSWRNRAIVVGLYVLYLCGDITLSHWDELFGHEQCDLVKTRLWYQQVVTLGYRKPRPHFVRLVTVTPPQDPCAYRALLADLLGRIAMLRPTIIVLDYSFSPHDCGDTTEALRNSIQSITVAGQIPVVFGVASSTMQEVEDKHPTDLQPLKEAGFTSHDQAIWASDVLADGSTTIMGLYRLDCDTRRIPTDWPVYEKRNGHWERISKPMPTIGFAAAVLYDPTLANRPEFRGEENPLTSFIPEKHFLPVAAREILSEHANSADWLFQRKIVVVGDAVSDRHDSVVGRVPGVVLQANYIESLLDDRYFTGLGPRDATIATFGCLLVIGILFDKSASRNRALVLTAFLLLSMIFMSYVALVHFGRLFTFWAPCILAIPTAYVAKLHS